MRFVVISGSSRAGAQSRKVADWMHAALAQEGQQVEMIDLHKAALPLIHEAIWDEIETNEVAQTIRTQLTAADGYVLVAPEWNGMLAPAVKNFLTYVNHTMAHKPVYIVGISASHGGANPVTELRMSAAKNTRMCFVPEHLIIRRVKEMLNSAEPAEGSDDAYVQGRAHYGLRQLIVYAEALQLVRAAGVVDFEAYANGMS